MLHGIANLLTIVRKQQPNAHIAVYGLCYRKDVEMSKVDDLNEKLVQLVAELSKTDANIKYASLSEMIGRFFICF